MKVEFTAILVCVMVSSCATREEECHEEALAFRECVLAYCEDHPTEACRCFAAYSGWSNERCICIYDSPDLVFEDYCVEGPPGSDGIDRTMMDLERGCEAPEVFAASPCWDF